MCVVRYLLYLLDDRHQNYLINMQNNIAKTIIGAVALTGTAVAGSAVAPVQEAASHSGSFCETIQNIGKVYKDSTNPYIQEVSIFGRFQAQYAYLDGNDQNGDDFNQHFDEARRVRLGAKVKAFNGFEFKANINLVKDDRPKGGDRDWGYDSFDEAKATYSFGDLMGLQDVKVSYGRHKIGVGFEAHESSKKIKTVERSALSNTIYGPRYTGLLLSGKRAGVAGTVGVLSLDKSRFVGNWDAGTAIYASARFEALQGTVILDAFYNLDYGDASKDQIGVGYEQAYSASWLGDVRGWDFAANVVVGDKGSDADAGGAERGGAFWGLVLQPSRFLIEDKLEFVTQYQYQGSSSDAGIRANSRYLSRIESKNASVDINSRRGDAHHSIYAGLNYHFCGHNSKIMTGIQYEKLDTPAGSDNVDATSLWAAYRLYF